MKDEDDDLRELNELLQLAGSSAERPSSYKLPSAADLDAARKDMTIASHFLNFVILALMVGRYSQRKQKCAWRASRGDINLAELEWANKSNDNN